MHLLQVYSNPAPGVIAPQELLFRSTQSTSSQDSTHPRKRSAKQLRDCEIDNLVARYREIANMRQLSREFKLSRTTVAILLARRGIDTSRGMKPKDVQRAVELYNQGQSNISIGKTLGFDNHTVLAALRREGVAIRTALRR